MAGGKAYNDILIATSNKGASFDEFWLEGCLWD